MTTHVFACNKCLKTITYESDVTTGYGTDSHGDRICFDCCAEGDKEVMRSKGKISLYLTNKGLTNWPGTLVIPVKYYREGRHNIAGKRYDVWFVFEGQEWHGVQYGDNTQVCHCKAIKSTAKC